eukprot:scaffold102022_cov30-Tisochrysis_lutea.AAC.3
MNTRALYTQQKYNLLREESEGYSKLITELAELPAAPGSTFGAGSIPALGSSANSRDVSTSTRACASAAEVVANVQSLIGYFDLDPNRVLDLVLEALEVSVRVHASSPRRGSPKSLTGGLLTSQGTGQGAGGVHAHQLRAVPHRPFRRALDTPASSSYSTRAIFHMFSDSSSSFITTSTRHPRCECPQSLTRDSSSSLTLRSR